MWSLSKYPKRTGLKEAYCPPNSCLVAFLVAGAGSPRRLKRSTGQMNHLLPPWFLSNRQSLPLPGGYWGYGDEKYLWYSVICCLCATLFPAPCRHSVVPGVQPPAMEGGIQHDIQSADLIMAANYRGQHPFPSIYVAC